MRTSPGSLSATDFVAWYNAHPDHRDFDVDLSTTHAVVVGNGNVAVDVARILVTSVDALARTDIADHALERLRTSRVRVVTMLGRRGPAQAAFTPKEIRELGDLEGVTLRVDPADLELDERSAAALDEDGGRVMNALASVAGRIPGPSDRVIELRFLTSPTELRGRRREGHRSRRRRERAGGPGRHAAGARDRPRRDPGGGAGPAGGGLPRRTHRGIPVRRAGGSHPERCRTDPRGARRGATPGSIRRRVDQTRTAGRHRHEQGGCRGDRRRPPGRPRGRPAPHPGGPDASRRGGDDP